MVKYDYQKFLSEKKEEIKRVCNSHDLSIEHFPAKNMFVLNISKLYGYNEDDERKFTYYMYRININQDGAKFLFCGIRPKCRIKQDLDLIINDCARELSQILILMEQYKFEPVAYEIWSDKPNEKYYIKDASKSLCNTVVMLEESGDEQ